MKSALHTLYDVLLPRRCAVCGCRLKAKEVGLCVSCLLQLQHPVLLDASFSEVLRRLWGELPVRKGVALCYYQRSSDIHLLFQEMKYRGRIDLCQWMGQMLAKTLSDTDFFQGIDFIVPIPLSQRRKSWRGYNQSEHIAVGISQVTSLPILPDLLIRHIDNESQTHKSYQERQENVKDIFRVKERVCLSRFAPPSRPPHFLVVDDVVTTGATLSSAIRTLYERLPDATFSVASIALTRE